jgi:hypothetical protein
MGARCSKPERRCRMSWTFWTPRTPALPTARWSSTTKPKPVQPFVFARGNPAKPGAERARQFLSILAGPERNLSSKVVADWRWRSRSRALRIL